MSTCCENSYYSTEYTAPDCNIECLSGATPGAIFVGSTGDIYVLAQEDPCELGSWKPFADCCISFTNLEDDYVVCCSEDVVMTSLNGTVTIVTSPTGIDFAADVEITIKDAQGDEVVLSHESVLTLLGENGITVNVSGQQVMFTGNATMGASLPSGTPTPSNYLHFYYNTTNKALYVWNGTAWIKSTTLITVNQIAGNVPTTPTATSAPANPGTGDIYYVQYDSGHVIWVYNGTIWQIKARFDEPVPLPVANIAYIQRDNIVELNGTNSTSTQEGVTISTYLWTSNAPGDVVFVNPNIANTSATIDYGSDVRITLRVTDSNGKIGEDYVLIKTNNRAECDIKLAIPSGAFAVPTAPTDTEVNAYIATLNPQPNNRTIFYLTGSGTVTSPDFVWIYTC